MTEFTKLLQVHTLTLQKNLQTTYLTRILMQWGLCFIKPKIKVIKKTKEKQEGVAV